MIIDLE